MAPLTSTDAMELPEQIEPRHAVRGRVRRRAPVDYDDCRVRAADRSLQHTVMPQARTLVMGDPQAPFARVMEVLERHGAVDGEGQLAAGVVLVSIGDHFDYDLADPVTAGQEGLRVLRWLASHDAAQVQLVFGNHDAARVMELSAVDDAQFARAGELARSIADTAQRDGWVAASRRERAEFLPRFPEIPTYGLAGRDYASFCVEQRQLVIELLLAGRFHLALAGELLDGRAVLLTHAGVTARELALLGMPDERDPRRIAARLEARLHDAVERVRADWQRGVMTPLSLEPLHVAGRAGEEGGGLLYHRPACPERRGADRRWEFEPTRPRRFEPRTLPPGLLQVAGHTGHHKCMAELGDAWPTNAARHRAHGGIRTLRAHGDRVIYDLGILPAAPGAADLYLIDSEMRSVPAAEYELLELARLVKSGIWT